MAVELAPNMSTRHAMDKKSESTRSRQIVGFSLPPEIAASVKLEAAKRKLSLRKLFEEIWEGYNASQKQRAHIP